MQRSLQQDSDERLFQLYGQGQVDAFEVLYERHKGGLYRYFVRQVNSLPLAQDLYQETWSRAINAVHSYQPSAQFTTWLYTLARNQLIDHIRHQRVSQTVEFDNVESQISLPLDSRSCEFESQLSLQQQGKALKACLDRLPGLLLDVFLLKEESGLTIRQIAGIVDASVEATKSRFRYAQSQLQTCMNKHSSTTLSGAHRGQNE